MCGPSSRKSTYDLKILMWKRAGRMKASKVQQVAPMRLMSTPKLGMTSTTSPVLHTTISRMKFCAHNCNLSPGLHNKGDVHGKIRLVERSYNDSVTNKISLLEKNKGP